MAIHKGSIDIHCHLGARSGALGADTHSKPEHEPYDYYMGADSKAHNGTMFPTIVAPLFEAAPRIEYMDRMGVEKQALSNFVSEYYYWVPGKVGAEAARKQNDHIAQAVADHPDRFIGFGATLPMQDVDMAIAEMDRCIDDLGMKGFQIGGTVASYNLDEPRFRPFWAAVQDRGLPVTIHPSGYSESARFDKYFLTNCIGNPLETMVASTRMIFSGLFEEMPDIKLILLHGGGYLPGYVSRADHTWEVRPETRVHIPDHPPSHYMKMLYYDTMVFKTQALTHLIEIVGPDRVMLGTDFPFDMGEEDPIGLIDSVPGLSDDDRNNIKGGNASRLFGI